jgi:CheY-like chemotaxis protein
VQALLSGKKPDLMIVDVNMPEVSGLDLIEFLRRRPEWKDTPIIMLSTEAADTTVEKALKLGADAYVLKPVTLEELEKAMADAFSKHTVTKIKPTKQNENREAARRTRTLQIILALLSILLILSMILSVMSN